MNVIDVLNREQLKDGIPHFRTGDTVKVFSKVIEGGKERTQMFEGVVTVRKGGGASAAITVRRIAHGVGVEKTFLVHSPRVEKIEVGKRGIVRAAVSTISAIRSVRPHASRKRRSRGTDAPPDATAALRAHLRLGGRAASPLG